MNPIKVGDHIWIRGQHSFHFDERVVVGETKISWVTVDAHSAGPYQTLSGYQPWYVERYAKKLPKRLKGYLVADEDSAKLHNWAISERYHIARKVEYATDPVIILAIAKLVGHKQPEGI
jgi:hypothetical protein